MLFRLGRFLRAAGYDTEIAGEGKADREIVARAVREDRLLLSCDRSLAEHKQAAGRLVLLPSNGLDRTAAVLGEAVPIDWLYQPFSRCLVDNAAVRSARPDERLSLPERAREIGGDIFVCPHCGRLYWPGSHVRRMRSRLTRWKQLAEE